MRDLPKDKLVGYDTHEGKELFKAALLEGGLEAFFPLSQQFLTVGRPSPRWPPPTQTSTDAEWYAAKRACLYGMMSESGYNGVLMGLLL